MERTNSWLSNFGQLRRSTDRDETHRLGQLALTIALILTVKIEQWAKRWTTWPTYPRALGLSGERCFWLDTPTWSAREAGHR